MATRIKATNKNSQIKTGCNDADTMSPKHDDSKLINVLGDEILDPPCVAFLHGRWISICRDTSEEAIRGVCLSLSLSLSLSMYIYVSICVRTCVCVYIYI